MAFVSKSCIEEWFKTDSWVYKHFSYLWENPVWSARVPGGFSLCPYFWMAMFSVCLFRPFIMPVLWLMKWLALGSCKPFGIFDRWFAKIVGQEGKPGVGLALALLLLAVLGVVIGIVGWCVWYYVTIIHPVVLARHCAWFAGMNLITLVGAAVYRKKHEYESDPCPVHWYPVVMFLATTTALYFAQPQAVAEGGAFAGMILKTGATATWAFLAYVFGMIVFGIAWFAKAVWFVLKTVAMMTVVVTVLSVPLLGWFALLLVVGGISGHIMAPKNATPKKHYANEEDWRRLVMYVCNNDNDAGSDSYDTIVRRTVQNIVADMDRPYCSYSHRAGSAVRRITNKLLEELTIPERLLKVSYREFCQLAKLVYKLADGDGYLSIPIIDRLWAKLKVPDVGTRRTHHHSDFDTMNKQAHQLLACSNTRMADREAVEDHITELFSRDEESYFKEMVDNEEIMRISKCEAATRKKVRSTTMSRICHAISNPIAFVCRIVFGTLRAVIWTFAMVGTWRVLSGTVKHVWIFIVYMWTVGKHMKKGACPYMMFTDDDYEEDKDEEDTPEEVRA